MCEIDGASLRDAALAGGDSAKEAFQSLWQAFYRRLSVFAASYRGLPAAERHDAVSDSIIAAFGALKSYDEGRPLSAWVYRIGAIEVTGDSGAGNPALSAVEIGRALGMPGGTIRWRINAIRARIRVATGEETP
jgi:DNA-directed RNA polymerase specialized sigma24 family protein